MASFGSINQNMHFPAASEFIGKGYKVKTNTKSTIALTC